MSRSSRRRASRAITFILICVLGTGTYFAVKKLRHRSAIGQVGAIAAANDAGKTAERASAAPGPVQPVTAEPALPAPLLAMTQTPTTAPALPPTSPATPAAIPAPAPAIEPPPASLTGNALTDGKARLDAGDPVGARKILNDALMSGQLAAEDAAAARSMISRMSQDLVFGRRIFHDDPLATSYTLAPGDKLLKIAASNGITWELIARINGVADPRRIRAGTALKIIKGPFHAVVTKSKFTLDLYLGSPGEAGATYVTTFPVGLGKDSSTPSGTWQAATKLKNPDYYSPRGEGIILSSDPRNPLGKFWIGLTGVDGHASGKMSYGIHGTIDPNSIGKEASMGCIRLRNDDIALVFEMLVEGKSRVVVKD